LTHLSGLLNCCEKNQGFYFRDVPQNAPGEELSSRVRCLYLKLIKYACTTLAPNDSVPQGNLGLFLSLYGVRLHIYPKNQKTTPRIKNLDRYTGVHYN
jgi:hypothetical protein